MFNNINADIKEVLLIGAGGMAIEYAKVLMAMEVKFSIVGRNYENAKQASIELGVQVHSGGINKYLENSLDIPNYAIVAVGVEELANVTQTLIDAGIKNILVEKPAGLYLKDIEETAIKSEKEKANVFVAYNRRFYGSVIKAKEIIAMDYGVKSMNFEFTEWSHVISKLNKPKKILEQWFYGNSTHVIDLAFYLAGNPKEFSTYTSGTIAWHPSASIFAGAGVTEKNILFSYQANWEAPGRWGLELLTNNHRLIFKPLEELSIQKLGSLKIENINLEDKLDQNFKPGLYKQTAAFINQEFSSGLLSIQEHLLNYKNIYTKIINPKVDSI